MSIELVIFDCDGVLVDSEAISCRTASMAFQQYGYAISYEEYVHLYAGKSRATVIALIEKLTGIDLPYNFSDKLEDQILTEFAAKLRPIENVELAIEASPLCCVASGSSLRRLYHSLSLTGLNKYFGFENIFNAAMVDNGKPAPDLFQLAAHKMGCDYRKCLVVEDSVAGVIAAKAAGMRCFGFTGGEHITDPRYAEQLKALGASDVFNTMKPLAMALRHLSLA